MGVVTGCGSGDPPPLGAPARSAGFMVQSTGPSPSQAGGWAPSHSTVWGSQGRGHIVGLAEREGAPRGRAGRGFTMEPTSLYVSVLAGLLGRRLSLLPLQVGSRRGSEMKVHLV